MNKLFWFGHGTCKWPNSFTGVKMLETKMNKDQINSLKCYATPLPNNVKFMAFHNQLSNYHLLKQGYLDIILPCTLYGVKAEKWMKLPEYKTWLKELAPVRDKSLPAAARFEAAVTTLAVDQGEE